MMTRGQFHSARGDYYPKLLLVRARPTARRFEPMMLTHAAPAEMLNAPGVSRLAQLERAGLITQVVPVSRPLSEAYDFAPEYRSMTSAVMGAMAGAGAVDSGPEPQASIVELADADSIEDLQGLLALDPHIEAVSRVPIRYLALPAKKKKRPQKRAGGAAPTKAAPTTPLWNLRKIEWAAARAASAYVEPESVKVAVLDTGIDDHHPDLRDSVQGYTHTFDRVPEASSRQDLIGHGTHVSGTIAASINNAIGINGVCRCELHAWKIFDDVADYDRRAGYFMYYVNPVMYLRALEDCVNQQVDVVNLSIGGGGKPSFQEKILFDRLLANGTTVVAAMGNERQWGSPTSYPAAIPGVVAVGATSLDDSVANFSNRGPHISVTAPGVAIWSTLPTYDGQTGFDAISGPDGPIEGKPHRRETNYDAWPGTSMATPHVAAAAAIAISNHGTTNASDTRGIIESTADKVSGMQDSSFTSDYGHGRINLRRIVEEGRP